MNEKIPLEEKAKLFLLENMSGNKERYSFSNPKFAEEIKFLESNSYALRVNSSPTHSYAITQAGIEFAAAQQKPYNS